MSAPKPTSLATIPDCKHNKPIPCIEGTIKSIWPPNTGTNSTGDWSIQRAILEGDGTSIPLQIKDRAELDESKWKGRRIRVTASNGPHGMNGLYAIDDEYNGKVTRKLKITPSADIQIMTAGQAGRQQNPEFEHSDNDGPPAQDGPKRQGNWEQPKTQSRPNQQGSGSGAKISTEVRQTIMQITNLHLLCQIAVDRYESKLFKEITGRDMGEQQRQAAASSLFIKADRLGLHCDMPNTPLKAADLTGGH